MNIYNYINKIEKIPNFLNKYLELDILQRLKNITYFCGMDYASKNIYNFKYKITRYDHSISCALLTWRYTNNKKNTLAALFHDISTPCFSHVIDYMNKDYENQESTEEKTYEILNNSKELKELLKQDNLTINDIDFKKHPIVDNKRPKLCTDRLDGIILTALSWTKQLNINETNNILNNIEIYENEIGFKDKEIANYIYNLNNNIDEYCHSKEDNYMMNLLANITEYIINKKIIEYNDLYIKTEKEIIKIFENLKNKDKNFENMYNKFTNITEEEIDIIDLPNIKKRNINPLVNGKRLY